LKALESPSQNGRQATPDWGVNWAGFCDKDFPDSQTDPQPKLRKIQLLSFSAFVSDSFRSLFPIKPLFRGLGKGCVWNPKQLGIPPTASGGLGCLPLKPPRKRFHQKSLGGKGAWA
jgi:hypothetical protein